MAKVDWTLASAILDTLAGAATRVNPYPWVHTRILRRYAIADDATIQATLDELVQSGQIEQKGQFYRLAPT
jgi:hypothetical protein